jgi:hypothetical protein
MLKLPPNCKRISVREFLEGIPTSGDGPIRRFGSIIHMQLYQEKAVDDENALVATLLILDSK